MNTEIKNSRISVEISAKGAEMQSIKTSDGTEYLWQGDKKYWDGRAYNLFPICCRLFSGGYTYKGKSYTMSSHGFIRGSILKSEKLSESSAVFTYVADENSRSQYPFEFIYRVIYELSGNSVKLKYEVENTDTKDIIFAAGSHPGFNDPLGNDGVFEDWFLEFGEKTEPRRLGVSETYFMLHENSPFALEDKKILHLEHHLFDNDAIVLENMAKSVTLKSKKSSRFVKVEYQNMKFLGIWHAQKSDAPYVCIEPWSSIPSYDNVVDDFEQKAEMVHLNPGKIYRNEVIITLG